MAIMVATAQPTVKLVDGEELLVTPFAGTSDGSEFSNFGVGYAPVGDSATMLWGLTMPQALIRSWRAMKLLDSMYRIDSDTLCACYSAASPDVRGSDLSRVEKLAAQFDNRDQFDSLRSSILEAVPSAEELDAMLTIVQEQDVSIYAGELQKLVEAGKLPDHPVIQELVRKQDEKSNAFNEWDNFVQRPEPAERSLGKFFRENGIDQLTEYDFDWGWSCFSLDKLDSRIKQVTTGKYASGSGFELKCAVEIGVVEAKEIAPGVTMQRRHFGHIIEPTLNVYGTQLTFMSAWYDVEREEILVKIEVVTPNADPVDYDMSVHELRAWTEPRP